MVCCAFFSTLVFWQCSEGAMSLADWTSQEWAALGQVAAALFTFIGVIVSLSLSIHALRESHADRRLRHRPYVLFEGGGHRRPVRFVKAGRCVPGINPAFANRYFAHLPEDILSVRLAEAGTVDGVVRPITYGTLRNYGVAPALNVSIKWIPKLTRRTPNQGIWEPVDSTDVRYAIQINEMPPVGGHILPGNATALARLPTFIEKDYKKELAEVHGYLVIQYTDVFGRRYTTRQGFIVLTDYTLPDPYFHTTFLDPIRRRKHRLSARLLRELERSKGIRDLRMRLANLIKPE